MKFRAISNGKAAVNLSSTCKKEKKRKEPEHRSFCCVSFWALQSFLVLPFIYVDSFIFIGG